MCTFSSLVLDVGSKYRVSLSAVDVIHAFTVPSLGFKIDCIPGRLSTVCITCCCKSTLHGQCSELCGSLHGFMPITVCVV